MYEQLARHILTSPRDRQAGAQAEEQVFVDFGEHEGKSVLEIADTLPDFYEFLMESKEDGKCTIRRSKDKIFRN